MRALQLLLVVLLGALLVQYTLAAATPKAADTKAASTPEAPKTVKTDPPKAEAPKPAAPKEAPKEVPKPPAEPPKAEAPKPKETPKAEAPKEVPKPEAPKAEAPKPAAPKETPKAEAPKEVPKTEAPKEVPKPAAPKAEVPKETPKPAAEAPKPAAPKEAPKAEAPKETPKETPKEAPKTEAPKKEAPKPEAPKQETPKPKTDTKPKTEGKAESKADASFVDTYYPIVQDYADQAINTAAKYAEVASEYAKEIGTQGAALAGDYYVVASKNLHQYSKAVEDYTYDQSVKTVDQFLDPQHAQIIKKNYLNWYGVGIVVAALLGAFLFIRHLTWVLSLTALRAYLSAVCLGVYGTLATLTFLTLRDPADSIKDASKLALFQTAALYISIGTTALSALSLVVLPGRVYNFIVLALSAGLFVDQLELRPTLEKQVGTIPEYSLETLVFLLQTILIFDSVARLGKTKTVTATKTKVEKVSSGPAPVYIKQEGEIKTEKSKKGSKAK